jgi:predicted ATP-binding protein involved in virulence/tRNA1(Val) A37 N6-methylase TrmN6
VVNKLNDIDFNLPGDRHEIGVIYEQILSDLRDAGNAGQHYTPRAVTQFMAERVDPQLGETVLDPACGTGGFLVSTIEHLRAKYKKTDDDEQTIQAAVQGIEENPLPHLLCVTNMVLHGIDAPRILRASALGRTIAGAKKKDEVDVVLTNPPFGGREEAGVEKSFPAAFRTGDTADLFLYLIMTLLRPGGRAAIVVPDGLLFGEGVKTRLKEKLLEECNLHTIVRLPRGVFSPYTVINTNLLFFTKGEPTREIWYYEHPCPEGVKSYSKTKPLRIEEFEPERTWWGKRKETRQAWKVSIHEIKARDYNLDLHWRGADTGQAPSRLSSLTLKGFRGFDSLELKLPKEGPAVLIGVNGAGKSTVLDAIGMLLSSFTALATRLPARQAEITLGESDIKAGDEAATVGATLRIGEEEHFWELRTSRARNAAPTRKESAGGRPRSARRARGARSGAPAGEEIAQQAEVFHDRLLRSEDASVPVLCFYSVNRGLGEDGNGKPLSSPFPQLHAYDRAFRRGLGAFHDFLRWFRLEEGLENQVRLRGAPSHRNPHLEIVRRALQRFLGRLGAARFSDLRIERSGEEKEGVLVIEKDGVPLHVEQLSEGEKNTILLVSDLARRFSIANPGIKDPLQGEGIVLIDEIDLHLHPGWQRGLLPALGDTFPNCQFIVSTHSPQVLSRITKEHVFIFENFELVRVTPHTYGRDANSMLGEVFGLPERPTDIEEKIRKAAILIDEERVAEAKAALDDLLSILGEHDTEVLRLRTVLSFVEAPVVD